MKIIKLTFLFTFILISVLLVKTLISKPKQQSIIRDEIILINQEIVLDGEVIVSRGRIAYMDTVISDNWLPFNKLTVEATLIYSFTISYELSGCEVNRIQDDYYVILGKEFNYQAPALIEEEFEVSKQMFAGKLSAEVYEELLERSRLYVKKEIIDLDRSNYRLAVETHIDVLLEKFNITKIHYVWE